MFNTYAPVSPAQIAGIAHRPEFERLLLAQETLSWADGPVIAKSCLKRAGEPAGLLFPAMLGCL